MWFDACATKERMRHETSERAQDQPTAILRDNMDTTVIEMTGTTDPTAKAVAARGPNGEEEEDPNASFYEVAPVLH